MRQRFLPLSMSLAVPGGMVPEVGKNLTFPDGQPVGGVNDDVITEVRSLAEVRPGCRGLLTFRADDF